MDVPSAIGLAGLLITIGVGFTKTTRALTRIELKVDIMWRWFTKEERALFRVGRRRGPGEPPDTADDWPA